MKKVFLIIGMLALTISMSSQALRVNETDEFTGSSKKYTKFYNLAKSNVGLIKASVMSIDGYKFLSVYSTGDLGCSGANGNYIILLFSDGSRKELKDLAAISCKDQAISLFDMTGLDVTGLEKVRFRQSEFYTDGIVYGTYSLNQMVNATK